MAGDVNQWCEDSVDETVYARYRTGDDAPPEGGTFRVTRGGSWKASKRLCGSSRRAANDPDARSDSFGFRVVLNAR